MDSQACARLGQSRDARADRAAITIAHQHGPGERVLRGTLAGCVSSSPGVGSTARRVGQAQGRSRPGRSTCYWTRDRPRADSGGGGGRSTAKLASRQRARRRPLRRACRQAERRVEIGRLETGAGEKGGLNGRGACGTNALDRTGWSQALWHTTMRHARERAGA